MAVQSAPLRLAVAVVVAAAACLPGTVVRGHGAPRPFDPPPVPSSIEAGDLQYTCNGRSFTGYYAVQAGSGLKEQKPAVLVAHTWTGLGKMEKFRSVQLAEAGYVAFALDVYGTGIRPSNEQEARGNMSAAEKNVTEFYSLLDCGLAHLYETQSSDGSVTVNKSLIFANGYCFGGQMVLELARRGVKDLRAVASFHGELGNLTSQSNDKISAVVSVHHANLDYQGAQGLLNFEQEMSSQNVARWSTAKYGTDVSHGWTDPTSMNYRPFPAKQSHDSMFALYKQVLQELLA